MPSGFVLLNVLAAEGKYLDGELRQRRGDDDLCLRNLNPEASLSGKFVSSELEPGLLRFIHSAN